MTQPITAFNHKQGARPRTWIAPDPAEIVKIAKVAAAAFGLTDWRQLRLPNRKQIHSEPRFAACLIARGHGHTFQVLATAFRCTKESVMYGVRKAADLVESDPEYAAKVTEAERLYRSKIEKTRKETQCQPD